MADAKLPYAIKNEITLKPETDIQVTQVQALAKLSDAVATIATFLTTGGLAEMLGAHARSQAVKEILGGLAAHSGRNALDARLVKQNALEITEAIEAVFAKYQERLEDKNRDPVIKEAPPEDSGG